MEWYHRNYLARNRFRAPFRPRPGNFGDRNFNRDYNYWRRQVGRPQRRFEAPRMDNVARARRAPWRNRQQFAIAYGADADYDDWLDARRYRPEELDDPDVFENIVADRRVNFAPDVYGLAPEDLIDLDIQEKKRVNDEIEDADLNDRALKRIKDEEA